MQGHFLLGLNIESFKCFKNFESGNFKRVNLIGGKNNTGKTALLEACFLANQLDEEAMTGFLTALMTFENIRKPIGEISQPMLDKLLQKHCPLKISLYNGISVAFHIENNRINFSAIHTNGKPILYFKQLNNFISNIGLDDYMIKLFDEVKKARKRDELNRLINDFDDDLIEGDVIDGEFKLFSKSMNNWMGISEYGDGIKHYVAVVCAIKAISNGVIFIDEIENGIHYTQLDSLWENILTASKAQNKQVFATTHSKECIEAYMRAAKKLEDKDITFIRLSRLQNGQIKASTLDYELLENSMEQDHEVRGW